MNYCSGDSNLLGQGYLKVAVVGSRRMTEYGRRVIEQIVPDLVGAGIVIVSGFMYGVDQAAHQTCLTAGGKTIAVLGWGIDWKVPSNDLSLYNSIRKTGLLVSEYPGETAPQLWKFPRRNRLMVEICDAVLVIEASERSGSLITANLAVKMKKKLFCVPGPITSSVSRGTNDLIKKGLAVGVSGADDILKELGKAQEKKIEPVFDKSGNVLEKIIVEILANETFLLDEIIKKIHRPVEEVGPAVAMMELKGRIKCSNGRYYLV